MYNTKARQWGVIHKAMTSAHLLEVVGLGNEAEKRKMSFTHTP